MSRAELRFLHFGAEDPRALYGQFRAAVEAAVAANVAPGKQRSAEARGEERRGDKRPRQETVNVAELGVKRRRADSVEVGEKRPRIEIAQDEPVLRIKGMGARRTPPAPLPAIVDRPPLALEFTLRPRWTTFRELVVSDHTNLQYFEWEYRVLHRASFILGDLCPAMRVRPPDWLRPTDAQHPAMMDAPLWKQPLHGSSNLPPLHTPRAREPCDFERASAALHGLTFLYQDLYLTNAHVAEARTKTDAFRIWVDYFEKLAELRFAVIGKGCDADTWQSFYVAARRLKQDPKASKTTITKLEALAFSPHARLDTFGWPKHPPGQHYAAPLPWPPRKTPPSPATSSEGSVQLSPTTPTARLPRIAVRARSPLPRDRKAP